MIDEATLLARPDVLQVAKTLGIPAAEYVERLRYYLSNPAAAPEVTVVEPDALKQAGERVIDLASVNAFFERAATVERTLRPTDGFEVRS